MGPPQRPGEPRPRRSVLVALLLACATLITLDYHGGTGSPVEPVRRAVGEVFGPVESAAASHDWPHVAGSDLMNYYDHLTPSALVGRIGIQVIGWDVRTKRAVYSKTSAIQVGATGRGAASPLGDSSFSRSDGPGWLGQSSSRGIATAASASQRSSAT